MLKLKKLLFEGRTNSISLDKAKSIFNKRIKSAWDWNNTYIFRGIEGFNSKYGFVEPFKHTRKSSVAKNYYTLILDNSKNWQSFPDRSRSIVCMTNREQAGYYGTSYFVLPFDGAKLGVAPMSDIWESFMTKEYSDFRLSNFERYLEGLNKHASKIGENRDRELPQDNYKKLKKEIRFIDKRLRNNEGRSGWGYEDIAQKETYGLKNLFTAM